MITAKNLKKKLDPLVEFYSKYRPQNKVIHVDLESIMRLKENEALKESSPNSKSIVHEFRPSVTRGSFIYRGFELIKHEH